MLPREVLALWASTKPTIRALYVFGSYAAGTAHAGSDLDLAFDFTGIDEADAELITNAASWKAELT
jgi:predicted nucleotidyltransferase